MGTIADAINTAFRDSVSFGVASSGPHDVVKSEVRAIGPLIETAIGNAALGALVDVVKVTRADLNADLAHDANTVALVYADATDANNDLYIKTGASGAGAWTLTTVLHDTIEGLAQPLVDDAAAAGAAIAAKYGLSLGNLFATLSSYGRQYFNGGIAYAVAGIKYPSGVTGQTSLIQPALSFDGAANEGRLIEIKLGFDQSATFTRTYNANFVVGTGGGDADRTGSATISSEVVGTRRVVSITYEMQGDETALKPYIITQAGAATATDETIELTDFVLYYQSALDDTRTAGDETLSELLPAVIDAAVFEQTGRYNRFAPIYRDGVAAAYPQVSVSNGAVAVGYGVKVPNGSAGNGSFIQMRLPIKDDDFKKFNGKRVIMRAIYSIVGTWDDRGPYNFGAFVGGSGAQTGLIGSASYDADRNAFIVEWDFTPSWTEGDATAYISPYFQFTDSGAVAADLTLSFDKDYWYAYSDALGVAAGFSQAEDWENAATRKQIEFERKTLALEATAPTVITANSNPASGADFTGRTAIQDAIDSITDAAEDRQYVIRCDGVFYANATAHYTKTQVGQHCFIVPKAYVHLDGRGRAKLIGTLPDADASWAYDVLHHDVNATVEGFDIYVKNIDYAAHYEGAGGTPNVNRVMRDCRLYHAGLVGSFPPAHGYGQSSGEVTVYENVTFESAGGGGGVYIHNNANFADPTEVLFKGCTILAGQPVGASARPAGLSIQSLGSGNRDVVRLDDTFIDGDVRYLGSAAWKNTTRDPSADHCEMELYAPNLAPRAVLHGSFANSALRFVSATTGVGSTIRFDETSTAFNAVAGRSDAAYAVEFLNALGMLQKHEYQYRDGGVGLAGEAITLLGIEENNFGGSVLYTRSLGKRLGDCSSVNKTLTVIVDGVSRNVVFNKNYDGTASGFAPNYSNATILAEINAALAGYATVTAYAPAKEHYPFFRGVGFAFNTDVTAILAGMGLYRTGQNRYRIATNADGRVDAIALDNIPAGGRGRVMADRSGEMNTAVSGERFSLKEVSTSTRAINSTLGISASTPGVFDPAATPALMRVSRTDVAVII